MRINWVWGGSVCLEVSAEESTPPLKFVCGDGTPPIPTFSTILPNTQPSIPL